MVNLCHSLLRSRILPQPRQCHRLEIHSSLVVRSQRYAFGKWKEAKRICVRAWLEKAGEKRQFDWSPTSWRYLCWWALLLAFDALALWREVATQLIMFLQDNLSFWLIWSMDSPIVLMPLVDARDPFRDIHRWSLWSYGSTYERPPNDPVSAKHSEGSSGVLCGEGRGNVGLVRGRVQER